MPYQSFEELEVWQRGCRLAVDIFKAFADCKESKEISSMLEGLRKSITKTPRSTPLQTIKLKP